MKLLKYYTHRSITILCAVLISNTIYAQNESYDIIQKNTFRSTICPGLGQAYNRKYWKIPVIYSALGGALYYYVDNNNKYHQYRSSYIAATDNNTNTINDSGYSATNLITLQDAYRNKRDFSALMFVLIYCLNIIDASVDAHLTYYNLNDNLSLSLNVNEVANTEIMNVCLKLNL